MVRVSSLPAIAAGALMLGAALPAAAADLGRPGASAAVVSQPLPDPFIWAGPYAGLFAGYAGGSATSDEVNGSRRYQGDSRGFVGGAVLGYQVNMQRYVFGLEAEIGHLGAETSTTKDVTGGALTFDSGLGLYGALAARGGYLVTPDLLLFARAGVVAADNRTSTTQSCTGPVYCGGAQSEADSKAKADDITFGGLLGLGVEKQFAGAWSARLDYSYFKFREDLALPAVDGPGWRSDTDAHVLRLGLSRRL